MCARLLGWTAVLVAAVVAAVLLWPQAFGLQNQWIATHVVALRGTAATAGVVLAVVFALIAIPRRTRWFGIAMASVLALFAVGNVAVLSARGLGQTDASHAAADPVEKVTVLAWNTLGEVPDAQTIVDLALREGADVISLPETTAPLGEEVAIAMREGGRPMWVHTLAYDEIAKARSTTLLISPDLGDYEVSSAAWPGPPDNTNTLPSVVADPVSGDGPRIVAVHAVAPIRWELRNWRSDLDWLAEQCAGEDVILAGDFNATLDHFAGRGVDGGDLGRCHDAALDGGAAGVGTWPTDVPEFFGSPIDHVLATPNWKVSTFRVVGELDQAGSDHRPIVTTLVRAGS
ncbi:endonuclease/exonuclease/phosphatase family protein [Agromyces aerolatus]|uniref:endonuclease/exonuclease/phosphatase family protein n=1 Tax=Agromyces sp. LY-1074 TaxID=3074080 RepID=UPI0028660914|nr:MULTISPECIES: endonuclease/exonuclease/phosphatase family protein [unclassified Agromyces]MDR5698928.1 endonuclease/exonuclease/phosphatase family protein [Agromyces sp. LY-1074]MDR5705294.1 endonuclease/exonuclease/phosphatase family protein [Agromyces sp. LY-1358]